MLIEDGEKTPNSNLLLHEDEVCVPAFDLSAEAALIIPGYVVSENNFLFDELFALICQPHAVMLLQDIIFGPTHEPKVNVLIFFR